MTAVVFYYRIDDDPEWFRGKYTCTFPLLIDSTLHSALVEKTLCGMNTIYQQHGLCSIDTIEIGPLLDVSHEAPKRVETNEKIWFDFFCTEDHEQITCFLYRNSNKL